MNERTFNQSLDKLRSRERIERLEIPDVVDLCLTGLPIKSVLDVGTGSGLFAEEFARHEIEVTGIDLNPEMIEAAKINLPESKFKIARAEDLPFNDKSFDLVFMGLVFHEVDDHLKVLHEAIRTAVKEIAILEWYYKKEEVGPPVEHRISEESIIGLAKKSGLSKFQVVPLKNLVLYKFFI